MSRYLIHRPGFDELKLLMGNVIRLHRRFGDRATAAGQAIPVPRWHGVVVSFRVGRKEEGVRRRRRYRVFVKPGSSDLQLRRLGLGVGFALRHGVCKRPAGDVQGFVVSISKDRVFGNW